MATTVTTKGQVTIPKEIRDLLGLKAGSRVAFRLAPDGNVVVAREDGKRPKSRFEKLRGSATAGLSTDEIMALMRGDP